MARTCQGTTYYRQGHLNSATGRTVRARTAEDKQVFLTIKGLTVGATPFEYEYEIPLDGGSRDQP